MNLDGTFAAQQEVRGGLTVNVPVTSSVPAVGTITTSPVVMQAVADGNVTRGQRLRSIRSSGGTTTIEVAVPAGFSTPANTPNQYFRTVTVNVDAPRICLWNYGCNAGSVTLRVGEDLQAWMPVYLESAPDGAGDDHGDVGGWSVALVSASETGAGAVAATVPNVANTSRRELWVHGLAQGQSTQVTLSAPGYAEPGDRRRWWIRRGLCCTATTRAACSRPTRRRRTLHSVCTRCA